MLSRELPFRLESVDQVVNDLVSRRLVPLRHRHQDVPEWLALVAQRAHAAQVEQRFQSATEFLEALETKTPYPEADDDSHVRTKLFVRVDLETPPPDLLRPGSAGSAQPAGDATRVETPQRRSPRDPRQELESAEMEPTVVVDDEEAEEDDDEMEPTVMADPSRQVISSSRTKPDSSPGGPGRRELHPDSAMQFEDTVMTSEPSRQGGRTGASHRHASGRDTGKERDERPVPADAPGQAAGDGAVAGLRVIVILALLALISGGIVAYIALGTF
jgi:hypothetical protein